MLARGIQPAGTRYYRHIVERARHHCLCHHGRSGGPALLSQMLSTCCARHNLCIVVGMSCCYGTATFHHIQSSAVRANYSRERERSSTLMNIVFFGRREEPIGWHGGDVKDFKIIPQLSPICRELEMKGALFRRKMDT